MASEPRVRITANVDYSLSVPASWVQDPEFQQNPDEAVFTWIVDNAGRCIDDMTVMDHTVWPARQNRRETR
jgi:hypothetical protein